MAVTPKAMPKVWVVFIESSGLKKGLVMEAPI
jgi:hypothetical protein